MAIFISGVVSDPDESIEAGSEFAIRAILNSDSDGELQGVEVYFKCEGEEEVYKADSDGGGVAEYIFLKEKAGQYTFIVYLDDEAGATKMNVTVKEAADGVIYSVVASTYVVPLDGTVGAKVKVRVTDSLGPGESGVANVSVVGAVTGGGVLEDGTKEQSLTTDSAGEAEFLVKSTNVLGIIKFTAKTGVDTTGKSIIIVPSEPLQVPHVLNTSEQDGWTLDKYDLEFGVSVVVPHYPKAKPGDTVVLNWGGVFKFEFRVKNPNEDLPREISVTKPEALAYGEHLVFYTVLDNANNNTISTGVRITVDDTSASHPTMPAPRIREGEDGWINIADASDGVICEISYERMLPDDFITFYWVGKDSNGVEISAASFSGLVENLAGASKVFVTIPAETFFPDGIQGYEGTGDAYYSVRREPLNQNTPLISHVATYRVDTLNP